MDLRYKKNYEIKIRIQIFDMVVFPFVWNKKQNNALLIYNNINCFFLDKINAQKQRRELSR